ncbi:hypothetical protein SASPL_152571 [Salvia splendens]|uniref:Uncharacterized protein n=1 Tax=Salvia splendens TaxID=180675 RepID=A0A8X8W3V8_SALSN|nr:hypothetical protein SASPL_152571 [Salvia splendens]
MGGGDQGAQQALQNLAGLLLLPRRHRPRIRHRRLLLRGPTARLNFPDCVPEYCHQDLSAAAIRKKATEDVVLYCKCFRKKGIISYNINNLNLEENESQEISGHSPEEVEGSMLLDEGIGRSVSGFPAVDSADVTNSAALHRSIYGSRLDWKEMPEG